MSHTVKVRVEIRDAAVLRLAVERLGGTWLGQGTHRLYRANQETGLGFTLPGWAYPLVLTASGEIAHDTYRAAAGYVGLDALTSRYALEAARLAAEVQGWYCEAQGTSLLIYHPDGGTLTVDAGGTVDASGWTGSGCADAALAVSEAIGAASVVTVKAEYLQEQARIREVGA